MQGQWNIWWQKTDGNIGFSDVKMGDYWVLDTTTLNGQKNRPPSGGKHGVTQTTQKVKVQQANGKGHEKTLEKATAIINFLVLQACIRCIRAQIPSVYRMSVFFKKIDHRTKVEPLK